MLLRPTTKILRPAARWARSLNVVFFPQYTGLTNAVNTVLGISQASVTALVFQAKPRTSVSGRRAIGFNAGYGTNDDDYVIFPPIPHGGDRTIIVGVDSDQQHELDREYDLCGSNAKLRIRLRSDSVLGNILRVFAPATASGNWYAQFTGRLRWAAVVFKNESGTTPDIYINGVKKTVTTSASMDGTSGTYEGTEYYLGSWSFLSFKGDVSFLFDWSRLLSQNEILELGTNPDAIWATSPRNYIGIDGPQTGWLRPIKRTLRPAGRWARRLGFVFFPEKAGIFNVVGSALGGNSGITYGIQPRTSVTGRRAFGFNSGYGTDGFDQIIFASVFHGGDRTTIIGCDTYIQPVANTYYDICGSAGKMDVCIESTGVGSTTFIRVKLYGSGGTATYSAQLPDRIRWLAVVSFRDVTLAPTIYINGVKITVTAVTATGTTTDYGPTNFYVGSRNNLAFKGDISFLFDWGRRLSEREILELGNNPSAIFDSAPVTVWSGGLLDWVAPPFVRRSQPQIPVGADRRSLAVFTPSRAGKFTTRAGTMTPVITQFGRGLESSSTGNRIEQLNPNGVLLPSSRLSLFFVGRIAPTTGGIGVASVLNGVTNYAAMLYVFGGADYAGYYPYVGGSVGCTSVPVKGYDIVIVGSYDGTTARVGVRNLNTNQKQINSSSLSNSSDFDRFRVGPTFSSQLFSTYFSGAFLDPLSAGEINAILDNPWRLLTRDPYVLHGAAGISTGIPFLSLATVINILQTQATPRVTVTF